MAQPAPAAARVRVVGAAIPNLPWEAKPAGNPDVVWRFSGNPVIGRRPLPDVTGIYNSAVVPWQGGFIGVFRTEYVTRMPFLHLGRSPDGLRWTIDPQPLRLGGGDGVAAFEYGYDPRVVQLGEWYYVLWCNGYHGPTIGMARTKDFVAFEQLENAFLPYNRNGVLFPRQVGGMYLMLSRPSDTGHTPFGDIFISQSPDLEFWGRHRHVMSKGGNWWQGVKIGAGPAPIETAEGWLMLYHGVCSTCNGFAYHMGAAVLDLERPWIVKHRCDRAILLPEAPYETTGLVPNVVFPVAALCDAPSGRIAVYYGAADTFCALAFCQVDEVLAYVRAHDEIRR